MYPTGNLFIPVSHGKLEAILKEPSGAARGVALVLHPHPLFEGTMHNKVVYRAARALNDAGLVALRFNFRGVGLSTGIHDDARGEQDDARAGLDYLQSRYPDLPVLLAGFSFGCRVGMEVGIADERVSRLVAIGTPTGKYDFGFMRKCTKPLMFVHGELDEFGTPESVQALAAEVPTLPLPEVHIVKGADHFFAGHLDELEAHISRWTQATEAKAKL